MVALVGALADSQALLHIAGAQPEHVRQQHDLPLAPVQLIYRLEHATGGLQQLGVVARVGRLGREERPGRRLVERHRRPAPPPTQLLEPAVGERPAQRRLAVARRATLALGLEQLAPGVLVDVVEVLDDDPVEKNATSR